MNGHAHVAQFQLPENKSLQLGLLEGHIIVNW